MINQVGYSKRGMHRASPEYLKLRDYIAEQPHGVMLSYIKVEADTGVKMDAVGQGKLRRAILANKREYILHIGEGYELAQASNAINVVNTGIYKVNNALTRAVRRADNVGDAFMMELSEEDRQNLLFKRSVMGGIQGSLEIGRKLYGKTQHELAIPIPKI